MTKRIVFKRSMLQRHRAVCHFVDPIIEAGYELFVEIQSKKFNLKKIQKNPCNAGVASKKSFVYLLNNFGIPCKNLSKINFIGKKNKIKGLNLLIDKRKTKKKFVSLPYTSFHCMDKKGTYLVGNRMCELLRHVQSNTKEESGSLLFVHPGGGRGYVSPVRKDISKSKIAKNNIKLLRKVFSFLLLILKK